MIDENKIEEAAKSNLDYWFSPNMESAFKDGFKAGINWFLDNLWHDVSEVPDKRKYIIVEYSNKRVCRDEPFSPYEVQWLYKDFTGEPWKKLVEHEKITRWFYIDDLLKGGK